MLLSVISSAPVQDASTGVRRAHALRKKMNEVDAYAEARELPELLRQELCSYYQNVWFSYQGRPLKSSALPSCCFGNRFPLQIGILMAFLVDAECL